MKNFLKVFSFFLFLTFTAFSLICFSGCKNHAKKPSYTLNLSYNDGIISGKLAYKFVNNHNSVVDCIKFNLRANAYSERSPLPPVSSTNLSRAYPDGVSYGNTEILKVSSPDKDLTYSISEDGLFLTVQTEPISHSGEFTVEIEFSTAIPNSTLRLGKNSLTVNLGDFFPTACYYDGKAFIETPYSPIGDPYFFDVSDYFVNLTVPSVYTVASSGCPTQTEVGEGFTTYSYQLLSGRDFAFCLSDKYEVFNKRVDEVTFNYYSFSNDGGKTLDFIIDCFNFYKKTFGEIPYKSISVAESNFIYGGMEYSGLCLIRNDLTDAELKKTISHELAHQWWYGGVGCDQFSSAYLDEGLCEYSSYLYFLNADQTVANSIISNAKSAYKSFFKIEELLSGKVLTTMDRTLNEFKSEYEYINIAYNKSLLAFYEYGQTVGINKAKKGLKKLYLNNYLSIIDRQKLVSALGYGEHFSSFIDGKVLI